jgi:hypothetical protein
MPPSLNGASQWRTSIICANKKHTPSDNKGIVTTSKLFGKEEDLKTIRTILIELNYNFFIRPVSNVNSCIFFIQFIQLRIVNAFWKNGFEEEKNSNYHVITYEALEVFAVKPRRRYDL